MLVVKPRLQTDFTTIFDNFREILFQDNKALYECAQSCKSTAALFWTYSVQSLTFIHTWPKWVIMWLMMLFVAPPTKSLITNAHIDPGDQMGGWIVLIYGQVKKCVTMAWRVIESSLLHLMMCFRPIGSLEKTSIHFCRFSGDPDQMSKQPFW